MGVNREQMEGWRRMDAGMMDAGTMGEGRWVREDGGVQSLIQQLIFF